MLTPQGFHCEVCERWLRTVSLDLQREGYKVGVEKVADNRFPSYPQFELPGGRIVSGFLTLETAKRLIGESSEQNQTRQQGTGLRLLEEPIASGRGIAGQVRQSDDDTQGTATSKTGIAIGSGISAGQRANLTVPKISGPVNGRQGLIDHLYSHNNHRGKWSRAYLNSLSMDALERLHTDDHMGRSAMPLFVPSVTFGGGCPNCR